MANIGAPTFPVGNVGGAAGASASNLDSNRHPKL